MMPEDKTKLIDVKKGDVVCLTNYYKKTLVEVKRTTKTLVIIHGICGGERKFNRATGYEIGSKPGYRWSIFCPNQDLIDQINFIELRNRVYHLIVEKRALNNLSFEQLQELLESLSK